MPAHDLTTLPLTTQVAAFRDGSVSATALATSYLERIATHDALLGSYLHVAHEHALAHAARLDAKRQRGEPLGALAGACLGLKDVLVTQHMPTTAGSKMLEGWQAPYDGTAVSRLLAADALVLGKNNCDEFAMGSSNENSAYRPVRNPWHTDHVPGGSSGGSAAAVAARLCAASIGTDTGGSVRQPAAFCGVVGLKPTYGRISRYGVIAYASSLDQVGPLAHTVEDAARLCQVMAGHDPRDATSLSAPLPDFDAALARSVQGLRIGLPREYLAAADELSPEIRAAHARALVMLRDAGAELVEVSLPHTQYVLATYYLIATAEASSNLARYDGVRYGYRATLPGNATLSELYARTRAEGFGPEVKRRIMLGTFALRAGHYDEYYQQAQRVRALITRDFHEAFAKVDVLLTPTTPTPAFPLGAKATPMAMYLADIFTLSCNLAGLPGISVPLGLSPAGLPVAVQLLGKPLDEATLITVGQALEARAGWVGQQPAWLAQGGQP